MLLRRRSAQSFAGQEVPREAQGRPTFCQCAHRGRLRPAQAMYQGRWNTHRQHHQPLRLVPRLLHRVQYSLLLPPCAAQGMHERLHLLGGQVPERGSPLLMNWESPPPCRSREPLSPTTISTMCSCRLRWGQRFPSIGLDQRKSSLCREAFEGRS